MACPMGHVTHVITNHRVAPRRRKTFTPKSMIRAPSAPQKKSSYWDRDWQAPNPMSLIPDKWYYRVLFASVLVGLTVYLNYAASH